MTKPQPFRFRWEQAFRASALKSAPMALGFYLATWAEIDGGNIFPGDERTAREMGVSTDTVERARAVLMSEGWLALVRRGNSRRKEASVYRLALPDHSAVVRGEVERSPRRSDPITPHDLDDHPAEVAGSPRTSAVPPAQVPAQYTNTENTNSGERIGGVVDVWAEAEALEFAERSSERDGADGAASFD